MAPKVVCLRCPDGPDLYRHGDNLAKCQIDVKDDGKPYSLSDLWPSFTGQDSKKCATKEEAIDFIQTTAQNVRSGISQPWSKATMEEAARLGFPESDARKKKSKTAKKSNPVPEMSKLRVDTPSSTSAISKGEDLTPTPSSPKPITVSQQPVGIQDASTPYEPDDTSAQAYPTKDTASEFDDASAPIDTAPQSQPIQDRQCDIVALADPSGPKFMTDQLQDTNKAVALQYAQELAGRLAFVEHEHQHRRNGVADEDRVPLSSHQVNDQKEALLLKYGLRTGFATTDPGARVETNFLGIKFPQRIYVYDVEMIRGYTAKQEPIMVKKPWDRLKILQTITFAQNAFPHYTVPLRGNLAFWVSDGSMIWSTIALFDASSPQQTPGPLTSPPGPVIAYEIETGSMLSLDTFKIKFRQDFDLTRPVGELYFDTTAASFSESGPNILTRGLNAFFTKYVRNRSDPAAPNTVSSFVLMGMNRSFATAGGALATALDKPTTLQAVPGFFLSVRPGVQSLYLNISNVTSPFIQSLDVQKFIELCVQGGRSIAETSNALKGLKVRIDYTSNNDALSFPRSNSRFRIITGITGDGYARSSPYKDHPEFPRSVDLSKQPLYHVNTGTTPTKNENEGEWHPATGVQIVPFLPFPGRMLSAQTSAMIKAALKAPLVQRNMLLGLLPGGGLRHFAFDGAAAGTNQGGLADANMSVQHQFIQIPGKWLEPPVIHYSGNNPQSRTATTLTPRLASWDLRTAKFMSRTALTGIPVLNLSGVTLPDFGHNLKAQLRVHGLVVDLQVPVRVRDVGRINHSELTLKWETTFRDELWLLIKNLKQRVPVLVVLNNFSYDQYASIKRVADLTMGVPTICVRKDVIISIANGKPGDLQKASNIALKYNMKMRGDNHHLDAPKLAPLRTGQIANTIVIGADVTHPSNASCLGTPSIAAVVGTTDDNFMKFPGSMRLQNSKKEDVVELADMVRERLVAWARNHKNQLPKNVLFYRDGVSESQYDIVRRRELPQIQTAINLAFRELNPNRPLDDPPAMPPTLSEIIDEKQGKDQKKMDKTEKLRAEKQQEEDQAAEIEGHPKNIAFNLTFIVVGKRHNTRFYPTKKADYLRDDPNKPNANVKPGLVVDQVITSPMSMDFYLQSHNPIQGTGRSAHYFVLRNNMALTVDQLHNITHTFCYAYARATKGVSYCAPAYYADRLCDRGRAYLRNLLINKNIPDDLPDRKKSKTFEEFKTKMKDHVYNSKEYRPRAPNGHGANPWHPSMDDVMFYL